MPAGDALQRARIVFLRNNRVFFMNRDGSRQWRPRIPGYPAWSPDGRRMVFYVTDPYGTTRLYIAKGDGTRRRLFVPLRATRHENCLDPVWSPNGRKIAYLRDCDVDFSSIDVVNRDGSRRKNLTPGNWSVDPAWSPDSRTIVFTSVRRPHGEFRLYLIGADGGHRSLIPGRYPAPYPFRFAPGAQWSRDGKSVFFISFERLFVVSRDGKRVRNLTPARGKIRQFELSPDGREIALAAAFENDEGWEIYVMNRDGRGLQRLTENRVYDIDPKWSPDGRKLLFSTERDGNFEIYVMNADGSGQTNLTRSPGDDFCPGWIPVARSFRC
jgi:Tol biopolymer transport system component